MSNQTQGISPRNSEEHQRKSPAISNTSTIDKSELNLKISDFTDSQTQPPTSPLSITNKINAQENLAENTQEKTTYETLIQKFLSNKRKRKGKKKKKQPKKKKTLNVVDEYYYKKSSDFLAPFLNDNEEIEDKIISPKTCIAIFQNLAELLQTKKNISGTKKPKILSKEEFEEKQKEIFEKIKKKISKEQFCFLASDILKKKKFGETLNITIDDITMKNIKKLEKKIEEFEEENKNKKIIPIIEEKKKEENLLKSIREMINNDSDLSESIDENSDDDESEED